MYDKCTDSYIFRCVIVYTLVCFTTANRYIIGKILTETYYFYTTRVRSIHTMGDRKQKTTFHNKTNKFVCNLVTKTLCTKLSERVSLAKLLAL